MKVENFIRIIEWIGHESWTDKEVLVVSDVWNKRNYVKLKIADHDEVVVNASELIKAIANATNNEFV